MFELKTESELLIQMSDAQRAERVALAHRLLSAGRLCQLRMAHVEATERDRWCIDNWEAVAAEVGAELGISRGRASSQMNYGVELLERFPKLAAVFAVGEVDFRIVVAAVFRAGLITEMDLLAEVDARIARHAAKWNAMSRNKIAEIIDWWISELDPAAVRVAREADADRHVEIGPGRDGLAELWGSVRAPDAAMLDRRLEQLAATVCSSDSRTKRQRRADAVAALAAGLSVLGCDCGLPDCPARGVVAEQSRIVIHLLADVDTVSGAGAAPGYLPGYGAIPAEAIRALAVGARMRPLAGSSELKAEPRYRPSQALADFIRCRDLTCRFPGCDKPAEVCDLDHTIPYGAGGLTHPTNLKLLCRGHHLVKTFGAGESGWGEQQFSDGTLIWTSPTGRVYTTTPGGALFFPQLATPTEELANTVAQSTNLTPGRTLLMPTRRHTRAAERTARIARERGRNETRWAAGSPPF